MHTAFENKIISKIEEFLFKFLKTQNKSFCNQFCNQMTRYQIATGGKRLRALIPAIVFKAHNQNAKTAILRDAAIALGAAVEMIHNATLVHDDLQDGDLYRRGKPTVWKKFGPAQAINCGDAMFYYAILILNKLKISADKKATLIELAIKQTLTVIEGQAQEFLMKNEKYPTLDRYLGMIEKKTGALFVLAFLLPLEFLNASLNASGKIKMQVKTFANKFGVFFQIQDDYIDIYGDKGRKKHASDIVEGKPSFFVAWINQFATKKDRLIIKRILEKSIKKSNVTTTRADINTALAIYEKYHLKEVALNELKKMKTSLISKAIQINIPLNAHQGGSLDTTPLRNDKC